MRWRGRRRHNSHSEKLSLPGLRSARARAPLYFFKNPRICQDCHSAMKIISKYMSRKLLLGIFVIFIAFREVHVLVPTTGSICMPVYNKNVESLREL